ncbi:hypothetical protein jhhlp_005247 [Lomentospora prolificans]|uniref:Uncharacterized protein n=1 Tax=Lomentospora prolificans TaxID=41688 RepID=A0A2N3N783_9PEZI|nr:hypothetical protein jhhlp_005247 [Lomentospora prolificans]
MYNRDNRIMRKLLGRVAPDNTADTSTGGIGITSAPSLAAPIYRSAVSQNAEYKAGVPILCLDASPDRRAAILGGRHILKTVTMDGLEVSEGFDLRAVISAQPALAKSGGASSIADQLSIKDVKWHGDSTIFTACSNGKIFSYDMTRFGSGPSALEFVQTREDSRQVNTLDINPHRGSYLLSGSQDGIVRCFDIRAPQTSWAGGLTFRAVQGFKCNADGVRHVKWSPTEGLCFACGTESGVIMKWDLRKANSPLLRLSAHDKACSAISWHPDGDHLMSAGWDSKCHVWNLSKNADKRQKAKWTISTPAPVAAVAWRPGLWSATAQGKRVAQVAVTYDDTSQKRYGINAIHVWDLARPTMPFKEIDRFDAPPSGLLWKDQDLLWTAGRDGIFSQCDVAFAPRVIDRQSLSSMAFSPRGDVMMFLDERPDAPRPRAPPPSSQPTVTVQRTTPYGSSPTAPMLSISRSDSEEDVVGSFVGPRRRIHRTQQRRHSRSMPNTSASSTPQSAPTPPDGYNLTLDQSLKVTGLFRTQQAMAFGHIPAAIKVEMYHYLAASYLRILEEELPCYEGSKPLVDRIGAIMELYAKTAENARFFRLGQTWRILAYVVNLLLIQRGQYHLEKRLGVSPDMPKDEPVTKLKEVVLQVPQKDNAGEETPRRLPSQGGLGPENRNLSVRSLLAEEIESTSNVPTPIARPVRDVDVENSFVPGKRLTPVIEPESFTLGPAAHPQLADSPRRRLDSMPISIESNGSGKTEQSITEGYDFYDTQALARAIDVPKASKPEPLPLNYGPQTPNSRAPIAVPGRSDDSFGHMFSASESTDTRPSDSELLPSLDSERAKHASRIRDLVAEREERQAATTQTTQSETTDGEYESRIRGRELPESPDIARARLVSKPKQAPALESPEDIFLISQTTMGTDPYSQGSLQSNTQSNPRSEYEKLNDNNDSEERSLELRIEKPNKKVNPPSSPSKDQSQEITEHDYLYWPGDRPYPYPLSSPKASTSTPTNASTPIDPYTIISHAIQFEARTSALNASAMVLLLRPLVPPSVIDPFHAMSILRQHHSRLMGMKRFVEAAQLRNLCIKGWPAGLPHWGADDSYTSLFAPAQQNVKVGFYCATCRKPRDIDPRDGELAIWRCSRCKAHMAPCAVCGHRVAPELDLGEPTLCTWWYCPSCAHGGHASCLQAWHADEDPDGCCPLDGCGHACLPGRYRAETGAARSEELGRYVVADKAGPKSRVASGGGIVGVSSSAPAPGASVGIAAAAGGVGGASGPPSVRTDANDVPQSRAVESVRETLGRGGMAQPSPGGRARERRKSVKFVGSGG